MTSPNALPLSRVKQLLGCLAGSESLLLLSSPGVGKSEVVCQAAAASGRVVRSLLGTQIAPEDVGGVPRVVGERSVFCPPRVLLPEDARPFCLFLDELPAAPAEVQKSFYSLLLERRVGETPLPAGTWVVAAGNVAADHAQVRPLSSALLNRLFVVPVRVDVPEWLAWASQSAVRPDVRHFIHAVPAALQRPVPRDPVPFSTPRSWTLLSRDLDLAEKAGELDPARRRALAFGRVSAHDAALFCAVNEDGLSGLLPLSEYLADPGKLPPHDMARWFVVSRLRRAVSSNELTPANDHVAAGQVNALLTALPDEFRFAALIDLVDSWAAAGASEVMLRTLKEVTGL